MNLYSDDNITAPYLGGDVIELDTVEKMGTYMTNYRNDFYKMIIGRYSEAFPFLIQLNYGEKTKKKNGIDYPLVEYNARMNNLVVIGKTRQGIHKMLGIIRAPNNGFDTANLLNQYQRLYTKDDIVFTVPKRERPKGKMIQMNKINGVANGDFIVIRNKQFNFTNDFELLDHYARTLSQIKLSRFSLSMQIRLMFIIKGKPNDTVTLNLLSSFYNGNFAFQANEYFNINERVIPFDTVSAVSGLQSLKNEYQNTFSEMNNMLGLNSLAVDKASGVSEAESQSNEPFVTANGNIYLVPREKQFELYNEVYGTDFQVSFNNMLAKELVKIGEGEKFDFKNYNDVQDDQIQTD